WVPERVARDVAVCASAAGVRMPAASAQADPTVKAAANRLLTRTTHSFITGLLEWVEKKSFSAGICAYGFGTLDESRTDVPGGRDVASDLSRKTPGQGMLAN